MPNKRKIRMPVTIKELRRKQTVATNSNAGNCLRKKQVNGYQKRKAKAGGIEHKPQL